MTRLEILRQVVESNANAVICCLLQYGNEKEEGGRETESEGGREEGRRREKYMLLLSYGQMWGLNGFCFHSGYVKQYLSQLLNL